MSISIHDAVKDLSWLGRVENVWNVGPYAVAQYTPYKTKGTAVTREPDDGKQKFAAYAPSAVAKKRSGISFGSLEGALAHAMAQDRLGMNTQAATFWEAMIGLTPEKLEEIDAEPTQTAA